MRNIATFAFALLIAVPVYAQLSIPGASNAISISMSPSYPAPNTAVTLSAQSNIYDLTDGTITWTANGKLIVQGIGEKTAQITTGASGVPTNVSVSVSADNGSAATAITIIPASVDLLWESNSYTPPLYRGRALSSAGSSITVVAIPHLLRSGGSAIATEQITYTWKKDGTTIASASGRGKSSAVFDGPMLYGTESISVIAASLDGSVAAAATLRIADVPTALVLYTDTPLFGTLYHKALTGTTYIPETEMSFFVVPYFAPVRSALDPRLTYDWTVNGSVVTTNPTKPYEITINAEKSSGLGAISLQLSHNSNFFFDAQGAWNVSFSNSAAAGGGGGIGDPFRRQ